MSNILTNNINPRSGNTITIGGVNDTVSIAGTVTYEDVTSVDSIGIITARQGVVIGTGASIGNPANNELGLYTDSSERLRIDSSGQVILNNSAGSGDATVLRITGGTNGSSVIEMGDTADTDIGQIAYYQGSNAMGFRVNAGERMRIDSSGNGANVTLKHNTTAGLIGLGDTLGRINFADSNGGEFASIRGENDGTESNLDYPGRISFWTTADNASSSTEKMRVNTLGQLLIGGVNSGSANTKLRVSGDIEVESSDSADLVGKVRCISNNITNLGTGDVALDAAPSMNAGCFVICITNQDGDDGTFMITTGKHSGVAHKYNLISGSNSNCNVSKSGTHGNVYTITSLGDGRTYTLTFNTGSGNNAPTIRADASTSGTTEIIIMCLGGL